MSVELRHLRYVLAVADELSFTRAAQRLRMAQPALSARIKDVERHLGTALFRRTTRSVSLTIAGEAFVAHARLAVRHYDQALQAVTDIAHGVRGRLVLGFFGAAALEMTGPILESFRLACPDVTVDMRQSGWEDPTAGLASGTCDVAIVRPPFTATGLRVVPLFSEPRIVAAAAGHPLVHAAAQGKPLSVHDLLEYPIVIRRCPDRRWVDFWLGADYRNGIPPTRTVPVGNLDEEMQAVAHGQALTLTAAAAARFYNRNGVRYLPLTDASPSIVAVAYHTPGDTIQQHFLQAARAAVTAHHHIVQAIAHPYDNANVITTPINTPRYGSIRSEASAPPPTTQRLTP